MAWGAFDPLVSQKSSSENNHPFTVALTGGIASGKTLVSDAFTALGVPVVDTDVIAHRLAEPGQPALREIEQTFGSDIIDDSGRLERPSSRRVRAFPVGRRDWHLYRVAKVFTDE